MAMKAQLLEMTADDYHADKIGDVPTLSASIAQRLVTRSPLHAWTHHPRLGGATRKNAKAPTKEMDRGTIVGQGHHDELLRDCETYKQLYERQLFLPAT